MVEEQPKAKPGRRLVVAVFVAVCVGLFVAGGSTAAYAEYLSPYPDYTYSSSTGYAIDPLNVFFGGTAGTPPGYWGSAEGVDVSLNAVTSFFDPVIGETQWVKFHSNLNNQVWRTHPYQLATSYTGGPRYHIRVFQDKYATSSGSYAEKNCVGDIHRESTLHHINMSWENAEYNTCSSWDAVATYYIDYENISNTPAQYWPDSDGVYWWTSGKMTKCRVYL